MPYQPTVSHSSSLTTQPVRAEAEAFTSRVTALLDGQPKDEATVTQALEGMDAMFDRMDRMAAGLYSLASMLVGEGEESVELVERAVATTEVSGCCDPQAACKSSRMALARAALERTARRDPAGLAAPQGHAAPASCIEEDDLDAVGVSAEELENMISGPDRDRVRAWLANLPTALRTVFALRAVAGLTAAETAELLSAYGPESARGWTPESVRDVFRQGLCSLASQLIHASAGR